MNRLCMIAVVVLLGVWPCAASVRYVVENHAAAAPPYTNWATAAATIQAAVDEAAAGDEILVSNGVYALGGRAYPGATSNRVVIDKAVTVRSMNGPEVTTIAGQHDPGGTNGVAAVRCVYLADGATLDGFLLTGGATRTVGDIYADLSGGGALCESTNARLVGCVIKDNTAHYFGGGVSHGTLESCRLMGNAAGFGGGAYLGRLERCWLENNRADEDGGGAFFSALSQCFLTGNRAGRNGGGLNGGTGLQCTLSGNQARFNGGGAMDAVLHASILYYNTALHDPNHAGCSIDASCTYPWPAGTGNFTNSPGLAGLANPHLAADSPCVDAGAWPIHSTLDIDGEPRTNGVVPDAGCDEVWPGALTGALAVAISATETQFAQGFTASFTAAITGRPASFTWNMGDGCQWTNETSVTHAYATSGMYEIVLCATNISMGACSTLRVEVVSTAQAICYVAPGGGHLPPFTNWSQAATSIQAAVDAAIPGGLVLVSNGLFASGGRVTDGLLSNRVAITKPLQVRSVHGPAATTIQGHQVTGTTQGDGAVRCVFLGSGSLLEGFTLTDGATRNQGDDSYDQSGAGVWCAAENATVSNCIITGNAAAYAGGGIHVGNAQSCQILDNQALYGGALSSATAVDCIIQSNRAFSGGGAFESWLERCELRGNAAAYGGGSADSQLASCLLLYNQAGDGGGAAGGALRQCTAVLNQANRGGGGYFCTLDGCIFVLNSSSNGVPDNWTNCTATHTCSQPLLAGSGNFTNDPAFRGAAQGNFRLLPASPCLNAGANAGWMIESLDRDGQPRIFNGTVDLGAFEYSTWDYDQDGIPDAWETGHGLNPAVSNTAASNADMDPCPDWEEYVADTDPTNALSFFDGITHASGTGILTVQVDSTSSNRLYALAWTTNLPGSSWTACNPPLAGTGGILSLVRTNTTPQCFHRVQVQLP